MFRYTATPRLKGFAIAASVLLAVLPVQAQSFQGDKILLGSANGAQNVNIRGYAKGSVALFQAVGDRDSSNRRCMGYGSLAPDHVIELGKGTSQITLQVKSQNQDTTLVVVGPDNRLYCADDSPTGEKDAGLVLSGLKAGTYKIWVGTLDAGLNIRYQLSLQSK